MRRRVLLVLLLAAALAPTLWLREPVPAKDLRQIIKVVDLMPRLEDSGGVPKLARADSAPRIAAAWHVSSPHFAFGSYSALGLAKGELIALSDRNGALWLTPPDRPAPWPFRIGQIFTGNPWRAKHVGDAEALTFAASPGAEPSTMWVAFEGKAKLARLSLDLADKRVIDAPEFRAWPQNRGAEALVRLADGRYVVLAEATVGWFDKRHPGLIYPGEPDAGVRPAHFKLALPSGYRPTDAALLPDGRVLVLARHVTFLLTFKAKLLVGDPAEIRAGRTWRLRTIATLDDDRINDNYEGLAVEAKPEGAVSLWLISDDNVSVRQRTLLLRLDWMPHVEPRSTPGASGKRQVNK